MKRALFLDLDHTLISPRSGDTFPQDVNDWQFMRNVLSLLGSRLYESSRNNEPELFIIVTNQGGVAAGFQAKEEVEQRLADIVAAMRNSFGSYARGMELPVYISYANDGDRKPQPGMAHKAAAEHGLDLSQCLMVGDMASDQLFATNAGMQFAWAADFFNNKEKALYVQPLNIREG